jgi:hypothetical protein
MDEPGRELEQLTRAGLEEGFLHTLPVTAAERLLEEGIRINVPAGALLYRHEESPRLIVVVNGLLRVFLASADGRQVTLRYSRSGDIAGLMMVFGGPAPQSIQAMTSSLVVALRVATLRATMDVARAFNCRTLAEGVESNDEADICVRMGIDLAQGYRYSRSLTAEALPAFWATRAVRSVPSVAHLGELARSDGDV